ncbi:hypothetical protein [Pantoea agglomerans]|uniref:hypothetical protein n=1 Tax=Enterobacter agglomerans TaxID=549 RepID=UPI00244780CC|nr:hypothetical protein [Pantoea agglomerans]MDH1168983.1 hypothetical protein [Pantoea agglomerans]
MEFLYEEHLKIVAGASGAYDPAGAGARQSQHGYGGQANGFVGTQSNCLDLGSVIRDNPCATGIVAGIIAGSGSWAGIAKSVAAVALTGQCFSGGNGNGGGSGNNYGGQCTW